MKPSSNSYIPALGYRSLTRFYDRIVRLTTREARFKDGLLRQARIQDRHRVLDLGCGTGTLALMIKQAYPSAEVVGVDADAETLELARRKTLAAVSEIRLDQGLASALPYGAASFDLVVSSLFFHHLSEQMKEQALLEVRRVLRPGGEVHIADWGKPTNPLMRLAFLAIQILDGFTTTRDSVMGVLPDMLSRAGFEGVETTCHYSTILGTLALYRAGKPFA